MTEANAGQTDKGFAQRLRLRRTLMGVTGYLLAYMVLISVFLLDRMAVSGLTLTIAILFSLLTNVVFLVLIITDWNIRLFREPSMAFPQVLMGLLWMLWAVWSAPEARGLMTLLVIPSFIFGLFRLNIRAQLILAAIVSIGYAFVVISHEYRQEGELALGITYWVAVTLTLIWLSFIAGHVSQLRQRLRERANELETTRDHLAKLSVTDELTGLFNRRHMQDIMGRERERAQRNGKTFSLAMFDLDHFKQINDVHGHLAGDEVLRCVSEAIQQLIRGYDWVGRVEGSVGRVGGEEFMLLLPEANAKEARQCAERIRKAIAQQPLNIRGEEIMVSTSIGVASFRPGESLDALLSRADDCLYEAKKQGRNRVVADTAA